MFKLPDISKTRGTPLYVSLYEGIKDNIINHEMNPDEKLPSKRKLAELLGVSLKTVENAYEQLMLEGFIYTEEKRGYFVANIEAYEVNAENQIDISKIFTGTKYVERQYKVNLRANRNAKDDFPENRWCQLIREALLEDRDKLFDVVPFNGVYELRKQIAVHLRETRGIDVSPDQIIVGAGTEYLYSRLKQTLGEDCVYGLPNPSTRRLHELYRNNGLKMHAIDADPEGPNIDQLNEYGCNVIHISPAHQYPLGHAMLMEARLELLMWANLKPGRYIIEDDYDSEYVVIGKPIPPLFSIDSRDKVIYMNTFSKSVGPAVRISYMILPSKLMEKYLETMSFYSCTVASLEQFTLARFISKNYLDRYIRKTNRRNTATRAELLAGLQPIIDEGKVTIISGNAGAHFLLKLETDMTDREIKRTVRKKDIICSMLSEYYLNDADDHQGVMVINYSGMDHEQIEYFLGVLREVLTGSAA